MLEHHILGKLVDSIFDTVVDIECIAGVSWIVWDDRHDSCFKQEVVPIKDQSITSSTSRPPPVGGESVSAVAG